MSAAVSMEDPESEDLEELLRRVIKQSFAEIASSSVEYPRKHAPAGPRRGRGYQPSGRFGIQRPPNPNQTGKDASSRGNCTSSTNPGGNPPMEQRPPLSYYSCGQLGYIARHCPNCSGKGEEERVGGIAHTPSSNVKRKDTVVVCNRDPDAPESIPHSPVSSRGEASTKRPSDAEARWWL